MNGCPVCNSDDGWCEFCPRTSVAGDESRGEKPLFSDDARKAFLAESDGLDFVRAEMQRIEGSREPERRIASHCFDGRFIALTFADGSTTIIGD